MIVVCWNMQGAGSGFQTSNASDALGLLSKGVDVLLLQEAGGYPEGWGLKEEQSGGMTVARGTVQTGTSSRGALVSVVWFDSKANTQASHNRCSMAVISKTSSGKCKLIEHAKASLRPLVGLETADGKWVYSIHAPSGSHKAASGVAANLLNQIPANEKWVCAGDYNCQPGDMVNRGFTPVAVNGETHQNGNTLDFACGNLKIELLTAGQKGVSTLVSDHYSQCFLVQ